MPFWGVSPRETVRSGSRPATGRFLSTNGFRQGATGVPFLAVLPRETVRSGLRPRSRPGDRGRFGRTVVATGDRRRAVFRQCLVSGGGDRGAILGRFAERNSPGGVATGCRRRAVLCQIMVSGWGDRSATWGRFADRNSPVGLATGDGPFFRQRLVSGGGERSAAKGGFAERNSPFGVATAAATGDRRPATGRFPAMFGFRRGRPECR